MDEKNTHAIEMAKLSHARLDHLTEEQRSQYFSLIRRGKKLEARLLISGSKSLDDVRT